MRKRFYPQWALVLALIVTLLAQAAPTVRADDLQSQLNQAQKDLEEIRRKQAETQNALADVQFQAEEAEVQLRIVEEELTEANSQLAVITEQLNATSAELTVVEADLAEAQKRYDQKKAVLGARIRAIRENGRVDYISVLFGSTTFRDFTGRLEMLSAIVRKDRQLFDGITADKLALEKRQEEVTIRKNRLATLQSEAEVRKTSIETKRNEREQVSRSLEESRRLLATRLAEYEAHTELLTQQVAELVRQMNRQAGRFAPIPPTSTPYIVTSEFGPRISPITGTYNPHRGTDFAVRYGAPVYAIEDGVVIVAGWDDVLGYLTVIDHGGGVTSWYGHSSKLLTKVNDTVTQGQQIAEGGSTGWSTGPHVHLEIHVNGSPKNPLEYIKADLTYMLD